MKHSLIPRRTTDIWDPFNWVRDFREDLNRPFGRSLLPAMSGARPFFAPDVDVRDEKDHLIVKADIPGIKKEDLSITVKDDLLTLKGERRESQEKKERDHYYSERFEGSFIRTVELPASVKAEGVKALYKDGVLEVMLPKDENAKPKEIKVQIQ